jgi:hypothetical protein
VQQTFAQTVDYAAPLEWTITSLGDAPPLAEWTAREGPYTVIQLEQHGLPPLPKFGPAIKTRAPPVPPSRTAVVPPRRGSTVSR